MAFNAFSNNMLTRLNEHFEMLQQVKDAKPIQHGAGFDFYSAGTMRGHAICSPSGGRPGDAYVAPPGTNANTELGLDILFNLAEVCNT